MWLLALLLVAVPAQHQLQAMYAMVAVAGAVLVGLGSKLQSQVVQLGARWVYMRRGLEEHAGEQLGGAELRLVSILDQHACSRTSRMPKGDLRIAGRLELEIWYQNAKFFTIIDDDCSNTPANLVALDTCFHIIPVAGSLCGSRLWPQVVQQVGMAEAAKNGPNRWLPVHAGRRHSMGRDHLQNSSSAGSGWSLHILQL